MNVFSKLRVRGRLLAGFLLCAAFAACAGGAGILSLRQIQGNMQATAADVNGLIEHQNALDRQFAALRGLVRDITQAQDEAALQQARRRLDTLQSSDKERTAESRQLWEAVERLWAHKLEQLQAAAELAGLREQSRKRLDEVAAAAHNIADSVEFDAIVGIEDTLAQVKEASEASHQALSTDLGGLSEQMSRAVATVRAAFSVRSRGQELNAAVKDALLARDPALVDYARNMTTTCINGARKELAGLPEGESVTRIANALDKLTELVDRMLAARKQVLAGGTGDGTQPDAGLDELTKAIAAELEAIDKATLEIVDNAEFDSTIAVDDAISAIEQRLEESEKGVLAKMEALSRTTTEGIDAIKAALRIRASCYELQGSLREVLLAQDAAKVKYVGDALAALFESMGSDLDTLSQRTDTQEVAQCLKTLPDVFKAMLAARQRTLAAAQSMDAASDQTAAALAAFDQALLAEAEDVRAGVGRTMQLTGALVTRWQTIQGLLGFGAVLAAIVVGLLVSGSIVRPLNRIIAGLKESARQVHEAATQVSMAAQTVAAGASEQASSLEQASSALTELASQTRSNADNTQSANELAEQARRNASRGDQTIQQLEVAMNAVSESSAEISKVIRVIEEIAFQTNLLALNAAVEAARAGEHGKGFAVVADEVRSLAQRCGEAARSTTELIANSVERTREGSSAASAATDALRAIVGDVTRVAELLNGISQATQEQAQGVDQINTAVTQVDQITQQNAAGAEEAASAAQELSRQVQSTRDMVTELAALVKRENG